MHGSKFDPNSCVAMSLDAEKAFDRVEWQYLFETMEKFNIGPKCINLVKLLYRHPTAQIQTNKDTSDRFVLSRGTRQGCCLSPLLFAIAIKNEYTAEIPLPLSDATNPSP